MIGIATAFVILGASIAPFLTPLYVHFEQSRTAVYSNTGLTWANIDRLSQSLLGDLVLWQGDFTVDDGGTDRTPAPALTGAERSHMRDVRTVFTEFWFLVLAGVIVLAIAFLRARDPNARLAAWRAARIGAAGLAVAIALASAFAVFAFDAAFEVFHRLFFGAGTYDFPASSKLIQLFPERFWSETAIIVGVVILVVALLTAWLAGRRAARVAAGA